MTLSMTTDYATHLGDPSPYLRRIADSGFSHVHWCHEWNTDHLYGRTEIERIAGMLGHLGLRVLDLHASHGEGCGWGSLDEALRQRTVELIENRILMTARLAGRAIVLHLPEEPECSRRRQHYWDAIYRSLDELEPVSRQVDVRIAIENMPEDSFADIQRVFARYRPDFVGLCYDAGHGNIGGQGLDRLELLRERLIAVHLHDNDGREDLHHLPFTGTVDWPRLARAIASSSYTSCLSLESNLRRHEMDADVFLAMGHAAGARLNEMVSTARGQSEPAVNDA